MQGGGGDPPNSGSPLSGSFGASGGSNNGPPSPMSSLGGDSFDGFGSPNDGPPSPMSIMFQPSLFGPPTMDPLPEISPPSLGFIENHHHQPPQPRLSGGPIIEEIIDLDYGDGEVYQENRVILGKHGRSGSEVESEEAIAEERRITHMRNMNENAMVNNGQWQPQAQGYSFQSSTVTNGGHDGNYYTSSTTRRTGSDGLTFEENKEANTATLEAAHRGHTVERTRNSDGQVDTNQIVYNVNEDELAGFEQSWCNSAGYYRSGLVNREQPVLRPPTDPSSSRSRGRHRRMNAMDLSRMGF